ncbi:MAG: sulfatase [Pyrinomonadaceae bacterium]
MKDKFTKVFTWCLCLAAACLTVPGQHDKKRPNVLIISADDMRDWVGYMNGYEGTVHTPNIDKLAEEGTAFSNAHTASTICNPSRNAFFLGKRPSTTGIYNNAQWWKPAYPDEVPMPVYFKRNGYLTAGAGKNFHDSPGNDPPSSWDQHQELGLDSPWNYAKWTVENYAIRYGHRGPIIQDPDFMPLNGILPISSPLDWGVIPDKPENEYADAETVEFAERFLSANQDKPFFLSVGIFRPHMPWYVPKKYFDMYPIEDVVIPTVKENDTDDLPAEGKKMGNQADYPKIIKAGKWREAVQGYLASITFADAQVGAILEALKKSKYADNTIVVFWSDHGYHMGSKGLMHKFTLWEESTKIPFVFKAPGISRAGSDVRKPVDVMNVYPTLLALCNLPAKRDLDGFDMTALIADPEAEWSRPAISEYRKGQVAVRSMNWRYIRYSDGSEELYDRNKDPNEWNNLAADPANEKVLAEHRKWIPKSFADPVPVKDAYFFDPYQYTWLVKETKEYIDGKK